MLKEIIECVPNFSEGREDKIIESKELGKMPRDIVSKEDLKKIYPKQPKKIKPLESETNVDIENRFMEEELPCESSVFEKINEIIKHINGEL